MSEDAKEILRVFAGVMSALVFLIGLAGGTADTITAREQGKTGCKYISIASFNPGRVLACELFRARFGKGE